MAIGLNEKMQRTLSLLMGLRNPRIFATMAQRGFDKEMLKEGWKLFTDAAGYKMDSDVSYDPLAPNEAKEMLSELDQWENTWYPVVDVTLEKRHPDVHEIVMKNLSQTEGNELLVSVKTLLDRLDEIASKPEGQEALAMLEKRGFTDEVRSRANALLEQLQSTGGVGDALNNDFFEQRDKSVEKMWNWYLEWSTIARTLINRGDILIRMGLREVDYGGSVEQQQVKL